jgi:hypothetical protein
MDETGQELSNRYAGLNQAFGQKKRADDEDQHLVFAGIQPHRSGSIVVISDSFECQPSLGIEVK